jgi:tetratricopeptide (TPR) repeat protein
VLAYESWFLGLLGLGRSDEAISLVRNMPTTDLQSVSTRASLYSRFPRREPSDDQVLIDLRSQLVEQIPTVFSIWKDRANAYVDAGQYELAIADLSEVIRLDPSVADHWIGRATIFQKHGKFDRASADFSEAIRLKPKPSLLNTLAWQLATAPSSNSRDGKWAVALASKACDLTYFKNAAFLDTLAAAYAEAGDFEKAVERQQQAIDLLGKKSTSSPDYILRLESYQSGRPWRIGGDEEKSPRPPGED